MRIVTYNIHRSRGMDGRVRPDRIVDVLREIDADVIALQEVLGLEGAGPKRDQARFFADQLGLQLQPGFVRRHRGGAYGNVILSRFPLASACTYDLSVALRERRGCLRADLEMGGGHLLHVFNIHLGTGFLERRRQARKLVDARIIDGEDLSGPRVVLGDFNEWTAGLTSRILAARLNSVDIRTHLRRKRTYPGLFPVLHLDHIYFDDALELERLTLHHTRTAMIASDHLPLVADFRIGTAAVAAGPPVVERTLLG